MTTDDDIPLGRNYSNRALRAWAMMELIAQGKVEMRILDNGEAQYRYMADEQGEYEWKTAVAMLHKW